MKRIWGHVVSVAAIGLAVSAALPACATNDQTIYINSMLAPAAQRVNGACVYTADPQQAHLSRGVLDIGLTDNYIAELLVGNQLISRGDPENNRAESNRAHVNGAIVRVTEPDGTFINEFTSYGGGVVADPQNNNTPGFAVYGITAIDTPTTNILRGKVTGTTSHMVLVNIKAFGKTLGGVDVESGEFQVPILVCNGCLVDFSQGYDPASAIQPRNCAKPLSTTGSTGGNTLPCRAGQDEFLNCQLCKGLPVCL